MVAITQVVMAVRTAICIEKVVAFIQRELPKKAPNQSKVKPSGGKVR